MQDLLKLLGIKKPKASPPQEINLEEINLKDLKFDYKDEEIKLDSDAIHKILWKNNIVEKFLIDTVNTNKIEIADDLLHIDTSFKNKFDKLLYTSTKDIAFNLINSLSSEQLNKIVNPVSDFMIAENHTDFFSASSKKPAENIIVVMTEVAWGTLGDYYAAEKFIIAMKKIYPEFAIQWLILNHNNSYLPPEAGSVADSCVTLNDWEEIIDMKSASPALKQGFWFDRCALVFQFPTFHFMSGKVENIIKHNIPKRTTVIPCLEYDYSKIAATTLLQAGLRDDSLGIFIRKTPLLSVTDCLKDIKGTKVGDFLLENTTSESYAENNVMFFGYFNKDFTRVINGDVNASIFCEIIANYTQKQKIPQKNLDIVCRMTKKEAQALDPNILFQSEVNRIVMMIDGEVAVVDNPRQSTQGRTVRIFSAFPFTTELFQQLLMLAYQSARASKLTPLIGCTGDQSLSEVLSLPGAVPFYQIMAWKQHLFKALQDISASHGLAHVFLKVISRSLVDMIDVNLTIAEVITLLGSPELQEEWCEIHEYILKNKNLFENLPKKLSTLIRLHHPQLAASETESHECSPMEIEATL